jgi:hypothetical protein
LHVAAALTGRLHRGGSMRNLMQLLGSLLRVLPGYW